MTVLITGASGVIGTRLTQLLLARGYKVRHLARSARNPVIETYLWDVGQKRIDANALKGTDAIIHLAGENIGARRWTARQKREILDSRVQSTRLLRDALIKHPGEVTAFISASAIGYYGGDHGAALISEDTPAGHGFLAGVAHQWEDEAAAISTLGRRVVIVRTGIVLSSKGGALEPMARQVRWGIGSPLGKGNQVMSWVHIDDHCRAFIHLLEHPALTGPFNSTAPHPVTNAQFMKTLSSTLHRPFFMPRVPSGLIKLVLGEMSALVLEGSNVSSEKLRSTGFTFGYAQLDEALRQLLIR